jgi:DNA-binding LytR/AlgR family response regulator
MVQPSSTAVKSLESFSDLRDVNSSRVVKIGSRLIRFELKRETFAWVQEDEIRFVKSADHYINALIKHDHNMKWMIRHSTLKEFHALLSLETFTRLNRFYIINRKYFSHLDCKRNLLFLTDGTPILLSHRISSFLIESIKA